MLSSHRFRAYAMLNLELPFSHKQILNKNGERMILADAYA